MRHRNCLILGDAPYLECAYKLVVYAGTPRLKTSTGKATLPGCKQIFRGMKMGEISGDTVTLDGEQGQGEPLLRKVMEKGRRLDPAADLSAIARYIRKQLNVLPENLRRLETDPPYPIRISPTLMRLREETRKLHG